MAFTFFFRDLPTLHAIRDYVIPELKNNKYINVWDAGCAMGPEPYSLAIIFKESLGYYQFKRLKIYATDLDEESHDFGKIIAKGIYPEETVKRIPKDIFKKYFSSNNKPGYFKISDEIMQRVSFQKHDLRSLTPVRDNFGLIVCKNVLLHFPEDERIKVIKMFYKALSPEGFFATEQTQKMPKESAHLFKHIKQNIQLFQKTE
ncbi:MAG: methyltransferase domain-containing protein [Deltaproteobacteria bacterium]|nr:methyltransferase domain-containing protein [Deltaproteobacteria bacterium]